MTERRASIPGVFLFCWAAAFYLTFLPKEPPFVSVPETFVSTLFSRGMYFPVEPPLFIHLCRTCFALALIGGVGTLFIRRVQGRGPGRTDWILGFAMGMVLIAVPLEILAIFHLLSQWSVIASLVLAAGVAALPWSRWVGPQDEPSRRPDSEGAPSAGTEPDSPPGWERGVWWCAVALIGIISAFTFYHAVLLPVVYHDSLIYYVNYAKWTYQDGGFPVKVCAQVGLGLGANYPHLYHLIQVVPAFLFRAWSDTPGQFLPPFLGVLSTILVYRTARTLDQGKFLSILVALLFRSIPYGVAYFIHASDYALAMFFTALFFYLAARLFREPDLPFLLFLGLTAAGAAKVNYLMPFLSLVFLLIAVWRMQKTVSAGERKRVIAVLVVCLVIGSTWYVRNWVVAGNPVYPFFHGIFGGKNIDEDVLRSCEVEWLRNGEGVERFVSEMEANFRDQLETMGPVSRFLTRLKWVTWDMFVAAEPNYHWKFAPILVGFAVPGFVLLLVSMVSGLRSRIGSRRAFVFLTLGVFLFLLFYEYVISGIYLYQIIVIVVPISFLAIPPLRAMSAPALRAAAAILVLLIGIVPGLSVAIVGMKQMTAVRGPASARFQLPFMYLDEIDVSVAGREITSPREKFVALKFGDDYAMWTWMNDHLEENSTVLSHENRHHYLRRDIDIVHLDDCDLIRFYGKPWDDVRRYLAENDILYYLRIPNERNHPILRQLGLDPTLGSDWELVAEWGGNHLYRLKVGEVGEKATAKEAR